MTYWLNLFTGRTWREFQSAGSKLAGFREHNWKRAERIVPGDVFLCYLVGVSRWVGLLEVTGDRFRDTSPIYSEETFPVRFNVKPLAMSQPEHGVPMESLRGRLSFFKEGAPHWSGRVRSSPTQYSSEDGETIAIAVRAAASHPVARPVDARLLQRSSNLYKLRSGTGEDEVETVVSVPPTDEEEPEESLRGLDAVSHSEIQWRLLDLGSQMGLNVWAPKSDRGKRWQSREVGAVSGMIGSLPTQFNIATTKTIENIDVLWLSGQTIVAAFEVEHSTAIYSGLLRMSDLLTMQPNLDINLFLVGPDDRLAKFAREIARPTFSARKKPMHRMCRFLPYSKLNDRLEKAKDVIRHLKPEFLDDIAESYDPSADLVG